MLLESREISRCLSADQAPEPELTPGNCELFAEVIQHLQEEAVRLPPFVQLPGRVQVARAEATSDDTARRRAYTLRESGELGVVLGRRVDEAEDGVGRWAMPEACCACWLLGR